VVEETPAASKKEPLSSRGPPDIMIAFNLQRPSSTPLNGPKSGSGTFRTCLISELSLLSGVKRNNTQKGGFWPRAFATLVADLDTFVSTSIFCGIWLLLSLSVLILDQHIPDDWF
jgi:hypothetical protein